MKVEKQFSLNLNGRISLIQILGIFYLSSEVQETFLSNLLLPYLLVLYKCDRKVRVYIIFYVIISWWNYNGKRKHEYISCSVIRIIKPHSWILSPPELPA
jgi:hypothetical protein